MKLTPQTLAKQFCAGVYVNSVDAALWRASFRYLAQSPHGLSVKPQQIADLWAQYGGDVRARLRDDRLVLSVLRHYLVNLYQSQQAVRLYRGESWGLFDENAIGFCWTTDEALANSYAKGINAVDTGGVLLTCLAPPSAILGVSHAHPPTYICDPHQIQQCSTLAFYAKA